MKLRQIYRAVAVRPADGACKITWKTAWKLTSELTSKWITFKNTQSNFTLISLITFEVINETPPNLQGSCRNTCRWCLQNYMENGAPSAVTTTIALWICRTFHWLLQKLLLRLVWNLIEYFKSYSFRRQVRRQFSTVFHVILQAPSAGLTATAL